MPGACTLSAVTVCRFQPIGHFLSITILTEMQSAQNQSQNSFEVTSPLAAGGEAFTLLVKPGSHPPFSLCMGRQRTPDFSDCWPWSLCHAAPFMWPEKPGTASTEKVHSDKLTRM